MIEMTTPEVFTINIVFVNKHSSYKDECFQVCKKLLNINKFLFFITVIDY